MRRRAHDRPVPLDRDFALLFLAMIVIAAGNTALQSVMPAIGRRLGVPDLLIATTFSVSAIVWTIAAPWWARRSDRSGRTGMVLTGLAGFFASALLCGVALSLGLGGVVAPAVAIGLFVIARLVYGLFGAATPPAAQALIADRTGADTRTRALSLLASAFGLGTIIGPALAPLFVLPALGGLAGPAYVFAGVALVTVIVVGRGLSRERRDTAAHGAVSAYPSIGGAPTGASVVAATAPPAPVSVRLTDARIWPYMLVGLVIGHAQAMIGQSIGFLVIDRLALPPDAAQAAIGTVLMVGAGAALLAQWGLIPLLGLAPRALILWGSALAAAGSAAVGFAQGLHGLALAFALAMIGFGFLRPGFTAGASLAVGPESQGAVAGRTTAVNGAAFILGPTIGVGLYQLWSPLPYLVAAAALAATLGYALRSLRGGSGASDAPESGARSG